tara:strand:- start:424 stop:678 length:255 start_codon:yes stop_codon:yes gene_type:complete
MAKYIQSIDHVILFALTGKYYNVDYNSDVMEITPVDASDTDAQSLLDTLVAKMGLYKLADEHEEKAVESVFDGTELIDAITRRG